MIEYTLVIVIGVALTCLLFVLGVAGLIIARYGNLDSSPKVNTLERQLAESVEQKSLLGRDLWFTEELLKKAQERIKVVEEYAHEVEEGNWPFEWVVATKIKNERDKYKAQLAEKDAELAKWRATPFITTTGGKR